MTKETGVEPLILVVLNALVWQEMLGRELALSLLVSIFSIYLQMRTFTQIIMTMMREGNVSPNPVGCLTLISLTSDVHQFKLPGS